MDYDFSKLDDLISKLPDVNLAQFNDLLTPEMKIALKSLDAFYSQSRVLAAAQSAADSWKLSHPELSISGIAADAISQISFKSSQYFTDVDTYKNICQTVSALSEYALSAHPDYDPTQSVIDSMVSSAKVILESLDSSDDFPEDDYVTMDENPIKELEIPDTLAIPVGNNRIRMKTDIFIAILSGDLIPILLWIAGQIVDLHDAQSKAKEESQRLELEQERNDLIRENNQLFSQYIELLMSTDTSSSSESEQIEHLKESLPKSDSAPITSDSVPDNPQESHNSNLE